MSEYTVRDWQQNSSKQDMNYELYHFEIQALKAQVDQFQQYIGKLEQQFKDKAHRLQLQLEEQYVLNTHLKQQIILYEQQLTQSALRQKVNFSGQLETLIQELDQLTQLMKLKSDKIVQLEYENQGLTNQLYELETALEQQQFQNDHVEQQQCILQNQIEQLKQDKNELIIRMNDSHITIQKLSVELQCKSSQLLENSKQNQLQEQIREEITKAQMAHQEQFIKLLQQEVIDLKEQLKNK